MTALTNLLFPLTMEMVTPEGYPVILPHAKVHHMVHRSPVRNTATLIKGFKGIWILARTSDASLIDEIPSP